MGSIIESKSGLERICNTYHLLICKWTHHVSLLSTYCSTYLGSFYGLLETITKVNRLQINTEL